MPEVFLPHYSGFAFFICFMICRIYSKDKTETKQVDKALFLHSVFFLFFSFTRNNVTSLFIGNFYRELFVTLSISIKVLFLSRERFLKMVIKTHVTLNSDKAWFLGNHSARYQSGPSCSKG